ncbi:MAG TPA: hypothetical protein VI386_32685 [Candidatus Sulfotelmatobacter sp.]
MSKRNSILTLVLLALPLSGALGQDNSNPQSESAAPQEANQQTGNAPVPAFGTSAEGPTIDNPPISGVDQPGLEPHAAPVSYLQPGLHFSESADSNLENTLGTSAVHSVTRALGSLELQRLWSHYDLALDYVGGVGYYSANGLGFRDIQQLDIDQKITWKRGQVGIRDSFSYLPEGAFGGAYGANFSSLAGALGGLPPGSGISIEGTLGQVPRIMNMSLVDVTEYLSPKSSFTASGGYGFVHYTGDTGVQGINFLGSQEYSANAGYNRIVGKHDQVALVYGYQKYDFSVSGTSFASHIVQLMWGHRISGRMDFIVGAGPEITSIDSLQLPSIGQTVTVPPCQNFTGATGTVTECPANNVKVSVAGRASLRYKFPKTMLDLTYQRYTSSGSGFFAGAETDSVHLGASRSLSRVWTASVDLGYSHNKREVTLTGAQLQTCSNLLISCSGAQANTFDYGYVGVALHRQLGRAFHVYASYQFNELSFDPSFCGYSASGASLSPCNRMSQRHVGTIGLDWTPRPIRLD